MRLALALSVSALVFGVATASWAEARSLRDCAGIKPDAERLACYDALAGAATKPAAGLARTEERETVIRRCRAHMGDHGSAMVKFCVDQDMTALHALERYPAEYRPFIDRCMRTMGEYGWDMVKFCADEDIAAEKALRG